MSQKSYLELFFTPRAPKRKWTPENEAPAPVKEEEVKAEAALPKENAWVVAAEGAQAKQEPAKRFRKAKVAKAESDDDEVMDDDAPGPADEEKPKSSGPEAKVDVVDDVEVVVDEDKPKSSWPEAKVEVVEVEVVVDDDEDEEDVKQGTTKKAAAESFASAPPVPEWAAAGIVPFRFVAELLEAVDATTKRLEIQRLARDALGTVMHHAPQDLAAVLHILANRVAPPYANLELGVGDALLQKAIAAAFGRTPAKVKQEYEAKGDLGDVALAARAKQKTLPFGAKPKAPTAAAVAKIYRDLAQIEGSKSGDAKIAKIQKLIVAASPTETKYIIRGLQGKLRCGLAETTVVTALAQAALRWPTAAAQAKAPEALAREDILLDEARRLQRDAAARAASDDGTKKRGFFLLEGGSKTQARLPDEERVKLANDVVAAAYAESPSLEAVAMAVLAEPIFAVHAACRCRLGIPVDPMLAKPSKSVGEVLKRLLGQDITCEHKCHLLEDGTVKVFSRNLQDTTQKWPELQAVIADAAKAKGTKTAVIDAEIVAIDRETGNLLPFQRISTRKKVEFNVEDVLIQVIVKAFDLLILDGRSLLRAPLSERRAAMRGAFDPIPHKFDFADSVEISAEDDEFAASETIGAAMEAAIAAKSEGLMVKTMSYTYEPSKRSVNWLKLKKDYLDGGGDSLDLVVVGAYQGKGKRTGAFGAYLLACVDSDSGVLQTVCKLGTGFSDEALAEFDAECKPLVLASKPRHVVTGDSLADDVVWIEPKLVWEIRAADLSLSSAHKGALDRVEAGRGVGLRFPRLVRARPDKDAYHATTADQVLEMYLSQDSVKDTPAANDDSDDDGYL